MAGWCQSSAQKAHASAQISIILVRSPLIFGTVLVLYIRLENRLQPNIGFTLRRVLPVFTRSAITRPKPESHSEPIWMKSKAFWAHCRGLALAGFGHDARSSEFFLSGISNARFHRFTVGLITKFDHNTSIGVAMKAFGTEFWKLHRKGYFSKKQKKIKFFNVSWLHAAITPQWLQIARNLLPK